VFDSLKINFVHGYSMTLFPFWLEWAGVRLVGDHQVESCGQIKDIIMVSCRGRPWSCGNTLEPHYYGDTLGTW
jgi:hypothetical protein